MAFAAIGAITSAATSAAQAAENDKQARLNRQFQRKMRATAYQTAVEDMRKAGLNPILAGTNVQPAGNLSGAVSKGFQKPDIAGSAKAATEVPLIKEKKKTETKLQEQLHTKSLDNLANADARLAQAQLLGEQRITEQQRRMQLELTNVGLAVEAGIWESEWGKFLKAGQLLSPTMSSAAQLGAAIGLRNVGRGRYGPKSSQKNPKKTQRRQTRRRQTKEGDTIEDVFLKEW